jgi:hypothetical protein
MGLICENPGKNGFRPVFVTGLAEVLATKQKGEDRARQVIGNMSVCLIMGTEEICGSSQTLFNAEACAFFHVIVD